MLCDMPSRPQVSYIIKNLQIYLFAFLKSLKPRKAADSRGLHIHNIYMGRPKARWKFSRQDLYPGTSTDLAVFVY